MKKCISMVSTGLVTIVGCLNAAADGTSPLTGEEINSIPYLLGGVAIVLLAAVVILSVLSKKKK